MGRFGTHTPKVTIMGFLKLTPAGEKGVRQYDTFSPNCSLLLRLDWDKKGRRCLINLRSAVDMV